MKSRFKKNKNILTITAIIATIFVVSSLASVDTFADDIYGATVVVDAAEEVLEVNAPAVTDLVLTPIRGEDAFGTTEMEIIVSTNSPFGYTLSMKTESADLVRLGQSVNGSLPTIAAMTTAPNVDGYSAVDFESSETDTYTMNRWGYKISTDSLFIPMVANSQINLGSSVAASNGDSYKLDFAAKVDRTMPAGAYSNTLILTAVATPRPYYMDEVALWHNELTDTSPIIEDVVDFRDGSTYDVVLLSDGNVWMKNNLNLAGGTELTLCNTQIECSLYRRGGIRYLDMIHVAYEYATFYTLPDSSDATGSFSSDSVAYVYNSGNTVCGGNTPCNSYYSYKAVTDDFPVDSFAGLSDLDSSIAAMHIDICPPGWELPSLNNYLTVSSSQNNMNLLNLTTGGMMENATLSNTSNGYYWTSTISNDQPYSFIYNSGGSSSQTYSGKQGQFVRCVFKPVVEP